MSGLLVAGTTSDAGKSLIVAGLCRLFAREGVRVAPFKSQNMSNNAMVCPDGTEIGRAQWVQAVAARAVPEAAMNPVLLKPGSDRTSHVVLMGRPHGRLGTGEWATGRRELARAAFEAYDDLASRYDLVVSEGAGSPAEVNLRGGDYVNFGLARAKNLPVVVVGDIDRGGVLASMYGTWGLVDEADRATLAGWIVNKFRGDVELLRPGLDILERRTGLPAYGVVPWLPDTWLDGEDALTLGAWRRSGASGAEHDAGPGSGAGAGPDAGRRGSGGDRALRVAVVGFTRISNATDADALASEPGVDVVVTSNLQELREADLVVLPGSRSTFGDLAWLREKGLDRVIAARAEGGLPVLGICGGYQMLAERISDEHGVEASVGRQVRGLGLLPVDITFEREKVLGTPTGSWRGHDVRAYEIHHGRARPQAGSTAEPFLDGFRYGSVFGTHWHGAFESDAFRREFLQVVAQMRGVRWQAVSAPGFAARREQMLERVADALEQSLDMAAIRRVAGIG